MNDAGSGENTNNRDRQDQNVHSQFRKTVHFYYMIVLIIEAHSKEVILDFMHCHILTGGPSGPVDPVSPVLPGIPSCPVTP